MGIPLALLAFLVGASGLFAQDSAESGPRKIYVGGVQAIPGEELKVPILLFAEDQDDPVQEVMAHVCLPEGHLDFVQVETGMGGQSGAAKIEVQRDQQERPDCVLTQIRASFGTKPDIGTLANLVFKVKEEAPTEQTIKVESQFELLKASGQKETTAGESEIEFVKTIQVFACFFYLH